MSENARMQGNTRGILAMIAAMACFTATDSLMKLATASIPPSQIIAVRGVLDGRQDAIGPLAWEPLLLLIGATVFYGALVRDASITSVFSVGNVEQVA